MLQWGWVSRKKHILIFELLGLSLRQLLYKLPDSFQGFLAPTLLDTQLIKFWVDLWKICKFPIFPTNN
jgi:hypothetical protein